MLLRRYSKKESAFLYVAKLIGGKTIWFGLLVCTVVLAGLAIGSVCITYHNGLGDALSETLTRYNGLSLFIRTLIVVVVLGIVLVLFVKSPVSSNWKRTLIVVCVAMAVIQVGWILVQNAHLTYYEDPKRLIMMARDWVSGSMQLFDRELPPTNEMRLATNYLVSYPYQAGMFMYYILMFKLFADSAPMAIQCMNIAANIGSVIALTSVGAVFVQKPNMRSMMIVLLGCCIPTLLYSSFLYTNQIGFALAIIFVALQVRLMSMEETKRRQVVFSLISIVCYCLALLLKATFVVFGIAMLLAWGIKVLNSPSVYRAICCAVCIAGIVLGGAVQSAPQSWIENRLGYPIGEGIPKTAWIVVGLQNDSVLGRTMPGWWNPYALNIWMQTNNDYEEMGNLAWDELKNLVEGFAANPAYAWWFFSTKLCTEWFTPDFQSRYFAAINYALVDGRELQFNTGMVGNDGSSSMYFAASSRAWMMVENLVGVMDGYQSLIYIFSAIGCMDMLRNKQRSMEHAVLPCLFIVGFVLYVLWEAKAQYLLPFFMCLIPMGAYGFACTLETIERFFPFRFTANSQA